MHGNVMRRELFGQCSSCLVVRVDVEQRWCLSAVCFTMAVQVFAFACISDGVIG
jgi:hypothetical protein